MRQKLETVAIKSDSEPAAVAGERCGKWMPGEKMTPAGPRPTSSGAVERSALSGSERAANVVAAATRDALRIPGLADDRLIIRLLEENPKTKRVLRTAQAFLDALQYLAGAGGNPPHKEAEYRMYRPSLGWQPLAATDREHLRANLAHVPLIVDRPFGHGKDSVWLNGAVVELTSKQFAFICVLLRHGGKIHRDGLPDLLQDETQDRDWEPNNSAIETLKGTLQKKMRAFGEFEIKGKDRLYTLVCPDDFLFIDEM